MSRRVKREDPDVKDPTPPPLAKRTRKSASPMPPSHASSGTLQLSQTPSLSGTPEPQLARGAGKGNRGPGGRGTNRAAVKAAEAKAEAELHMAVDSTAHQPATADELALVEHENRPKLNIADGRTLQVKLPLSVGTIVETKWRDGCNYAARVIERRKLDGAEEHQYYVHYLKFNRRMDDWVNLEDLDLSTIELAEEEIDSHGKAKIKRKHEEEHDDEDHAMFDANALKEHEEFTKVKNVEVIELGRYEMETWYFSPLPEEYRDCKKLYFAEFDLSFYKTKQQMLDHLKKCKLQYPPGDEIYRNGNISMFEVDGKKEQHYCQNLAYLAKLFLDHKSLYSDVEIFLFYVLCEVDERGAHVVGYFSKEKMSEEGCNLACILALPPYQRKGYGKFLISMSYELSKIEGKVGTPERPLSDLGKASYRGYWTRQILAVLLNHTGTISIKDISLKTAIKPEDIRTTLEEHLNLVQMAKGQKVLCADPELLQKHLKQAGSAGLIVDPSKIVWTPYNSEREMAAYRN